MRSATVLFLTLTVVLGNVCFAKVELGKEVRRDVRISVGLESAHAELRIVEVTLTNAAERAVTGVVLVVHDLRSHKFWWTFERSLAAPDILEIGNRVEQTWRWVRDDDQIIGFTVLGRSLWSRKVGVDWASEQVALRQITRALDESASQIRSGEKVWGVEYDLLRILGSDFLSAGRFDGPIDAVKLTTATLNDDGRWHLGINNELGDTRKVSVASSLNDVRIVDEPLKEQGRD